MSTLSLVQDIEALPYDYMQEAIDFIAFLRERVKRMSYSRPVMDEKTELALINKNADKLNAEAMDVLRFQQVDI
ncbi:MAG: hypothetical protein LBM77_07360 [Spirochaetaceae bacterium]|jgi:hypothetical protein|nr:hypothetical protein [Spirochaetaceae bacterium]